MYLARTAEFYFKIHKANIGLSLNQLPNANKQKYEAQAQVSIYTDEKTFEKVFH